MPSERHRIEGLTAHPEMTVACKRVLDRLANPAMVDTSPVRPGRLTVITPERPASYPVVMAVQPLNAATNVNVWQGGSTPHERLRVIVLAKMTGGGLMVMDWLARSGQMRDAGPKKPLPLGSAPGIPSRVPRQMVNLQASSESWREKTSPGGAGARRDGLRAARAMRRSE